MRQHGYTLLGTEPTHKMGGTYNDPLDHVYLRSNVNFFGKVAIQTYPDYFSDDDAII